MANSLGYGVTRVRDGTWKPLRGLYLYRNSNLLTVEYLVVGGGGAAVGLGGGGGGGVKTGSTTFVKNTTVPVVVGLGGIGGSTRADAWTKTDGQNSSIGDIIAYGGGGGGFSNDLLPLTVLDLSVPQNFTVGYDTLLKKYTDIPSLPNPTPAATSIVAFGTTDQASWLFDGKSSITPSTSDTGDWKFMHDSTTKYTAEMWFNAESIATADFAPLIYTTGSASQRGFWFGLSDPNRTGGNSTNMRASISFYHFTSSTYRIYYTAADIWDRNTWNHVALVYDSATSANVTKTGIVTNMPHTPAANTDGWYTRLGSVGTDPYSSRQWIVVVNGTVVYNSTTTPPPNTQFKPGTYRGTSFNESPWHDPIMAFDVILVSTTEVKIYLNGVSQALTMQETWYDPDGDNDADEPGEPFSFDTALAKFMGPPSNKLAIGASFKGKITNLRITKDKLYVANFTPSTVPLTALPKTVLLALTDQLNTDKSGKYVLIKSGNPVPKLVQPFDMLNYDSVSGGNYHYSRKLTAKSPVVLTNYDILTYLVNKGSNDNWGEIPDESSHDDLYVQYSLDGSTNWTQMDRVHPDDLAINTWTQRLITIPAGAKVAGGVYLRYVNSGVLGGNLNPPRDTYAVTGLYVSDSGRGRSGGSGGGGGAGLTAYPPNPAQLGGTATVGGAQGNNGGKGSYEGYNTSGGGGGGAGAPGYDFNASGGNGGNGGPGVQNLLLIGQAATGRPAPYYGGGGGGMRRGGYYSATTGLGGIGGGGNSYGEAGNKVARTAGDGVPNTGGGGGGYGGNGGSGVVIVRYPASAPLAKGGEISTYTLKGLQYYVHQFKSSGTLEVLPLQAGVQGEGNWIPVKTMWKKDNGEWTRVYPTPTAVMTATPSVVTLESYITFQSKTVTVTIQNTGEEDVNILSAAISSNPNFTLTLDYTDFGGSVVTTILANTSKSFGITMNGIAIGTSTSNIVFTAQVGALGNSPITVSVTGTTRPLFSYASVSLTEISWHSDTIAGQTPNPSSTLRITNTGNGPLAISSITASTGGPTITGAPASIAAGSSATFTITYNRRNAVSYKTFTDYVYINSDSIGGKLTTKITTAEIGHGTLTLTGTGNFTVPIGIYSITATARGAGGGGGGGQDKEEPMMLGSGGGGGAGAVATIPVAPGQVIPFSCGSGGGGGGPGAGGARGGNTTFATGSNGGPLLYAEGGYGGNTAGGTPGAGGAATQFAYKNTVTVTFSAVTQWTVPAYVRTLNVSISGGGGGGGGNDSKAGSVGAAGTLITGTIAVNTGDIIDIYPGTGGNGGGSGGGAAGGAGGGSTIGYGGGNGSNSGPVPWSGAGGGGGAATVVKKNATTVAVAGGGYGGGGGGNGSVGQGSEGRLLAVGTIKGGAGASKSGDGGGAGGGGGGAQAGDGGNVRGGDSGGYAGTSGTSSVSAGLAVAGNGAAGGGSGGGKGADGYVTITYDVVIATNGTATSVTPGGAGSAGTRWAPSSSTRYGGAGGSPNGGRGGGYNEGSETGFSGEAGGDGTITIVY